jgi:hypothetical protein
MNRVFLDVQDGTVGIQTISPGDLEASMFDDIIGLCGHLIDHCDRSLRGHLNRCFAGGLPPDGTYLMSVDENPGQWLRKQSSQTEANKAVDPTPVSAPRNSAGSSED